MFISVSHGISSHWKVHFPAKVAHVGDNYSIKRFIMSFRTVYLNVSLTRNKPREFLLLLLNKYPISNGRWKL